MILMDVVSRALREDGVLIIPLLGYAGITELRISNVGECYVFSDGYELCHPAEHPYSDEHVRRAKAILTAVYSILKGYKDADGYRPEAYDALLTHGVQENMRIYGASLALAKRLFGNKHVRYPSDAIPISPEVEKALLGSAVHDVTLKLGRSEIVEFEFGPVEVLAEHDGYVASVYFMSPVLYMWSDKFREYIVRMLRFSTVLLPRVARVSEPGREYELIRSILAAVADALRSAVSVVDDVNVKCRYSGDAAELVASYAFERGALTHREICVELLKHRLELLSRLVHDAFLAGGGHD
ncbi:MAG: hypothetical protein QXY39_03385 [Thermofilaceae archaeon]